MCSSDLFMLSCLHCCLLDFDSVCTRMARLASDLRNCNHKKDVLVVVFELAVVAPAASKYKDVLLK